MHTFTVRPNSAAATSAAQHRQEKALIAKQHTSMSSSLLFAPGYSPLRKDSRQAGSNLPTPTIIKCITTQTHLSQLLRPIAAPATRLSAPVVAAVCTQLLLMYHCCRCCAAQPLLLPQLPLPFIPLLLPLLLLLPVLPRHSLAPLSDGLFMTHAHDRGPVTGNRRRKHARQHASVNILIRLLLQQGGFWPFTQKRPIRNTTHQKFTSKVTHQSFLPW